MRLIAKRLRAGLGAWLVLLTGVAHGEVQIPRQSDWTDHGAVLNTGPAGAWDVRLEGAISPCAIVKADGTYFLYYIGADGNRSTDGGPRHRALGVATSSDGRNFVKHPGNPIVTYLPHNNQEEGIFSCTVLRNDDGHFILYYGALRAANPTTESVDIDIRMRTSTDGATFANDTLIRTLPGQEIEPVGAFRANGAWHVYYLNNSGWNLFLVSGPAEDDLPNSRSVLSSGSDIIGGTAPVPLSPDTIAVFLLRDRSDHLAEIRMALTSTPDRLSAPVEVYDFSNFDHFTVLLDEDTNTWWMYYLGGFNSIRLKTAPAVDDSPDTIPPAAPTGLVVE